LIIFSDYLQVFDFIDNHLLTPEVVKNAVEEKRTQDSYWMSFRAKYGKQRTEKRDNSPGESSEASPNSSSIA
jgi:hypothetical protein